MQSGRRFNSTPAQRSKRRQTIEQYALLLSWLLGKFLLVFLFFNVCNYFRITLLLCFRLDCVLFFCTTPHAQLRSTFAFSSCCYNFTFMWLLLLFFPSPLAANYGNNAFVTFMRYIYMNMHKYICTQAYMLAFSCQHGV